MDQDIAFGQVDGAVVSIGNADDPRPPQHGCRHEDLEMPLACQALGAFKQARGSSRSRRRYPPRKRPGRHAQDDSARRSALDAGDARRRGGGGEQGGNKAHRLIAARICRRGRERGSAECSPARSTREGRRGGAGQRPPPGVRRGN